jgi:hypothetical protein
MPVVVLTAALLLAAVGALFLTRNAVPALALATIQLAATRGDMPSTEPARETHIQLTDAGDFKDEAELVDESGSVIWKGRLTETGSIRVSKPLPIGTYFIRLYQDRRLTREYGFRVREYGLRVREYGLRVR